MTTPPKPPKPAKPPVKKDVAKSPELDKRPEPASREAQPAADKPRPALTVVKSEGAVTMASGLRLKELVDKVTETSGVKKPDVKKVIEATLIQIGAALKAGEGLNLVGLGRMRVARAAEGGGAMTLKLRMVGQGGGEKAEKPGADPLAAADDQD